MLSCRLAAYVQHPSTPPYCNAAELDPSYRQMTNTQHTKNWFYTAHYSVPAVYASHARACVIDARLFVARMQADLHNKMGK